MLHIIGVSSTAVAIYAWFLAGRMDCGVIKPVPEEVHEVRELVKRGETKHICHICEVRSKPPHPRPEFCAIVLEPTIACPSIITLL